MKTLNPKVVLKPFLRDNEGLRWAARPNSGLAFRKTDLWLLPLSLGCMVTGWILWKFISPAYASLWLKVFSLILIGIGLILLLKRFVLGPILHLQTVYGLTSERIIICRGFFDPDMVSYEFLTLPKITLHEKSDGSGMIKIWKHPVYPVRIQYIDEVGGLYELILVLKNKQLYPFRSTYALKFPQETVNPPKPEKKWYQAESSISHLVQPPPLSESAKTRSVADYLDLEAPGLLQEKRDHPTRLPALERSSSIYGGSNIHFYSIPKSEEKDPLSALAVLLLNANLGALGFIYERGQNHFLFLTVEGLKKKYESHPMKLNTAGEAQKAFEEIFQQMLTDYEKDCYWDDMPVEEDRFIALNPMLTGAIQCGYCTYTQKRCFGNEWFVETETDWVYWFWVGFV